ncbi:helicase protein MOM1 [Pistacia vera]|uniref:helicase protein MOM1 n=1 Tax=Pistacia vera TaxID=55513 RepID=UPI00126327B2|nr:helicase protein MOM1 [Pistacia vera]XP_031285189.1 helicase protein MOM1 [Pistacia vera]XP_031285196.1 helicase protein MOM1 [Pistacia vera]
MDARIYRALFKRQPKKVKVEDHNKELKMRDKSSQGYGSDREDESLKKVNSDLKDGSRKKVNSDHQDESLEKVKNDHKYESLKKVNNNIKDEGPKKVISDIESSERRHEELRDKEVPSFFEIAGEEPNAGINRSAQGASRVWEANGPDVGDSITFSKSGDTTIEAIADAEQAKVACLSKEKFPSPELLDSTVVGRTLDGVIGTERCHEVMPLKRKRKEVNVHPDTSSVIANKSSRSGEVITPPTECVDTCGTCFKRQRVDYDSTRQECCSCLLKPKEKLDEGLSDASIAKDRGKPGAGVTTELVANCGNHMQRNGSFVDIPADGFQNTCLICKLGGKLLFCDGIGCKRSYHLSCLDPPMENVALGAWYCIPCARKKIESGVHSLSKGIESIWDVGEEVSDADGSRKQKKYFVKYKGLAHVHNCWVPESQLLCEAPSLVSKFNRKNQVARWKVEWTLPHRLLQKRSLVSLRQYDEYFSEHDGGGLDCHYEWLVKWHGLDYEHSTWELETAPFIISPEGQSLIRDYENRHHKAKIASYLSSVEKKTEKVFPVKLDHLLTGGSSVSKNNLDFVNKLREYWHKGQNAVVFDDQERIVKVILFIKSLLSDVSQPFLIISTSPSLHSWEDEFSRLAPSADVVVYSGSKEIRTSLRTLEFYEEGGCIMFQALITSPEVVIEDLNVFESIGWEAIIVDECQRSKISSHLEQIKMLITKMRLLLVSGQLKDTIAEYLNMLSALDYQPDRGSLSNEGFITDSIDNIGTLKEKLSKYVAYGGKLDSSKFVEYWVPVQISNVQLEQYCATLLSNSSSLCSTLKNDPVGALRDILISTRKCCDHPYILDSFLRRALLDGLQVTEHLDVEIKASGKLQLLDTMLTEMKNQALRVLILFQSRGGAGKNSASLGNILEDYVQQRFGPHSYEHVDGNVIPSKKQASMNNFNKKSERFVFLLETRACLPSIKLSSVDTVIIFNSDCSPVNDLRALQKITLESQFEQIKVFRLYSSFTVEEKALILAKQDRPPDGYLQNMSRVSSHVLLMWGASYLFNRLVEYHVNDSLASGSSDIFEKSLLKNVTQEFLTILTKTGEDNDRSKLNVILKVKQDRGTYSATFPLFGESKIEVIDEGAPHVFWMKLLEGKTPCWKYSFVSSQRSRKRVRYLDDVKNKPEGENGEVVKKHKKVANNTVNPSSMKHGLGRKKASRNNEGTSRIPAQSETISLKHASPSPCLVNNISGIQRELYYSQKNLHLLLKAEISKLCEVLQLREDVKDMVEKFLEYFMINHPVSREPETILQAFQISVCWTAASLQKQKIGHKESFALAKQHLNVGCKKEDADLFYLKLQCLKKVFLCQLEKLKLADCPKASEISIKDIGGDHLHTSLSQTETPNLQKVKVEVEDWSTAQECSDKLDLSKVAQKDILKCINKIQKKFQKQMAKLFQKHQKETEHIHQQYEEEKANLENKKRTEAAIISHLHSHGNSSMKIDRLKILDNEYAKEFEELRSERDAKLKNLEEMKISAMKMVQEKEAIWVEEVKSWVEVEFSNKPPSNEFGHDVQNMLTSEQINAHDSLENIFPVSGHLSEERSPNNLVPITLVGGVESSGVHQTVPNEAAVCSHPIETVGPVGPSRVLSDKFDTIASERASVSGFQEHMHAGNLGDNQGKVVSMNSYSNQKVPDGAMLSMPGGQVQLEVTETVSSSDNPEDGHLAFHLSAEQICDRVPLNPDGELLMGVTKTASSNNLENVVSMNAPSLDEQIHDGATASITDTEVLLRVPEAEAHSSEEQIPCTAALTIPEAEAPVVVPENVSSSDGLETVASVNLSSSRVEIPDASLSMPDVEVQLGVPESSPDEVVEVSNTNEENDGLPAMSLDNATEVVQTDGVSCNVNVNLHLQDLSSVNSPSVQTPTTTAQDGPIPPNRAICSEVITSTIIQNGDAAAGEMQISSQQSVPSQSHPVDNVTSDPSNHVVAAEIQIPSQQLGVPEIPDASLSMPDVEVQLGVPESSPDELLEVSNTNEENDGLPAMSLDNATEVVQADGVSCNVNVNLHLQDLSSVNSPSVQTPTTTTQDGPIPPNRAICSEVITSTIIQNGDAAAGEMQIPSQSLPVDNVASDPSSHEAPASEPVAQMQVLPSIDVLSGHNPPDFPSASRVGAHPSSDHCITNQSAQAQNDVELPNQAVLQPSAGFAPSPTDGLGTNECDTNTASVPSGHSNRTVPNAAPVTYLYHDPLQKELERICRDKDKTVKTHEETKLRLKSDCEREIEEAVTQIRRKFEIKLKETETEFQSKKRELDAYHNQVLLNKILAEAFKAKCMDLKASSAGMQQELTSSFIQRLAQQSSQQSAAQRPSVLAGSSLSGSLATTSASTSTTPSTLLTTSLPPAASPHAAVPPLQAVHHSSALFSSGATRPPHISSVNSPAGNHQVGTGIRAPAPHLQPFRPSLPISSTSLPSSSVLPSQQMPSNPPATSLSLSQYPSRPPPPPTFHPSAYNRAHQPETVVGIPSLPNTSLPALELLRDFDARSGANPIPPSSLPPLPDLGSAVLPESALQSSMRASTGQVSGAADVVCLSDDE